MNPGKIWMPGGGGGADLDIITVTDSSDIIAGKTIIDKDGEPLIGTLSGTGTAQDNQVLNGYTYYNTNLKVKRTGNVTIQSILAFSAAVYSSTAISFYWQNPAKGPFSGVIIVGKTGGYPTSITDGTRYYKGSGNNTAANGTSGVTLSSFVGGMTYYFRAFSYAIKDGVEWIHETTYTATATTARGQQAFTSSGTFIIPAGVRSIDIFTVGGGGTGSYGSAGGGGKYCGSGGAGGFTKTVKGISVTPGQQISYTVGAAGGASYFTIGGTQYALSSGGANGVQNGSGGNGGSGGGGSAYSGSNNGVSYPAGAGGSNGSNGGRSSGGGAAGTGQGTTTRAFGDTSGTLYAGAGGGGGGNHTNAVRGSGGSGGGGNGEDDIGNSGSAGAFGTGGGGGGGKGGQYGNSSGKSGGSGVCIIRWGY